MTKIFMLFCLSVILMAQAPALACKPPLPNQTFDQALSSSPVVFIGKVTAIERGEVIVDVEHAFRGVSLGGYSTEAPPTTACLVFTPQIGQRWLFAGMFEPSRTMLLDNLNKDPQVTTEPTAPADLLTRLDDERLALPEDFQKCENDTECVPLPYECTETAVNRMQLIQAQDKVRARGKQPRYRNCNVEETKKIPWPICFKGKCGMWEVSQ